MKFGLLSKFSAFFILVFFSLDSADGAADECHFVVTSNWKKSAPPETDCPCFHSDSDSKNETCPGWIFVHSAS